MSTNHPPDTRTVAGSLSELFGRPVTGMPVATDDGKTGAPLERLTVDGQDFVLKHLHPNEGWVMRATDDRHLRAFAVWRDGWLDRLPSAIDHAIVAAAWDDRPDGRGAVLVMRDVADRLVPEGDATIPLDQHRTFIDHMAQLHVAFWDCREARGLLDLARRLVIFHPRLAEDERARGGTHPVPTRFVPHGWARLEARAPRAAELAFALLADPTPIVAALRATPQTLIHGDWKAGNLGNHTDGRTILLDWDAVGIAPPCSDIAWYVCINRARLPESRHATLAAYRDALESHGIDTGPWWERQCALSLLGVFLMLGWEKAVGDAEELAWWEERALEGARWLWP